MTEVSFVEVISSRLEMRACEIAERIYSQGERLQILAVDQEQAARLDDLLWTFKPDSFVPHGRWQGEENDPPHPVVITTRKQRIAGIGSLLMMEFCAVEMVGQFSKVIHMVAVDNRERLEASRSYWTQLKEAGFTLRHQKR